MNKLVSYFENAFDELLHKVTWPTWNQLVETTGIVLAGILLLMGIVFAMDLASETLFTFIYKVFK
jgi:preprotein translocase subunit SecE